jgi:superfamily II DNA or RNA helicase
MEQYSLRDYQQEAVDSVFRHWDNAIRSTMVVLPTGCGKTVVASSIAERLWERHHTKEDLYSGAILFLAHREELIMQTHEKFRKHIPDAKIAIEMADYRAYGQLHRKPEIVIASTSSMLSRYKKYPKDYFGAAFVDECFPAGTLVDDRPIESIKRGDIVNSWNHETNTVEQRKVLRVSKRIPTEVYELFLRSGQKFVCTGEHPFWVRAPDGKTAYLPARSLSPVMDVMKADGTWHPISIAMKVAESLDGKFCGRVPDKFVYNLEVEHNHNYFVDEYLVHNCHHSVGKSYTEPLSHFNDNLQCVLGLTATPKRHDGKAMGRIFDDVAFKMTLLQGIDRGWILEPRFARINVNEMDLNNVSIVAGDFSKSSLSKEMSRDSVLGRMVSETIERAAGRQTAIYCVDVDHMRAVEAALKGCLQTCCMIDGKTPGPVRKSRLRDFRERAVQFIISCGTLTEGWDCPECEVIAMFRPTQSESLYEQIVGRGLRPLFPPGESTPELRRAAIAASEKPFCLVLDFVGNSRHKLANLGDILGGSFDDQVKRLAMDLAKLEDGPVDMRELLKKAEAILDEQRAKQFRQGNGREKLTRAIWQLNPHPFDVLGIDREHAESAVSREDAYGRAPIEAAATLELYKLKSHEIKRLTNKQQVLLARVLLTRGKRGLCSYAQARLLYRFGYSANVPTIAASKILAACEAETWWRPDADGINPRLQEIADQKENRWLQPFVDEEIERHEKLLSVLPFR